MGCETMPTKTSESYGIQEREALQLVLENLSMIGLNSNLFEKEYTQRSEVNEIQQPLSDEPKRISANITENMHVPSSEHVAEIVGKQGCKIKALRNKTNTYIKTPGRGDEPVFIITGRREDVDVAKAEILQASEHFSNIRAQRKGIAPPPIQPGQITKTIRVPYRVVGLVVGPKGQTIKQIQQKTQTYIVTPSRERDPVFEITGLPDNVEQARIEISNYIAARTGTFIDAEKKAIAPAVSTSSTWNSAECRNNLSAAATEPVMSEEINGCLEELFSGTGHSKSSSEESLSKRNSVSVDHPLNGTSGGGGSNGMEDNGHELSTSVGNNIREPFMVWNPNYYNEALSMQSPLRVQPPTSNNSHNPSEHPHPPPPHPMEAVAMPPFRFEMSPLIKSSSFPVSCNSGIGIGPNSLSTGQSCNPNPPSSIVQAASSQGAGSGSDPWITTCNTNVSSAIAPPLHPPLTQPQLHQAPNHAHSDPAVITPPTATVAATTVANKCFACKLNGISAALVPCGHKVFCFECVSSLVQSSKAFCPVCHQKADHALRILQ